MTLKSRFLISAAVVCLVAATVQADDDGSESDKSGSDHGGSSNCGSLPGSGMLAKALASAVSAESSGLKNQMWATIVDRDGIVCAVAFSGTNRGSQWPGSRVISAQKANTANAFSLDSSSFSNGFGQANGLALSTANLYSPVQPGGSLFGLQESNPVDTTVAYKGPSANYGTANDPMVGSKIGGVNVFGGGLGLYATGEKLVGGVGVSGDTSCTDHDVAWRVRNNLGLDHLGNVGGVSGDAARPDNIIYGVGGYGHPTCSPSPGDQTKLPSVQP